MSHKRKKTKCRNGTVKKETEHKFSISAKTKRELFRVGFVVLVVLFVSAWVSVFVTSHRFQKQMESMVQGKDYFVEDVVITKKKVESYASSSLSTAKNYFFYYGYDGQKMQVPTRIYQQYEVGSEIAAYTTDHIHYGFEKNAVLPREQFRNNEIMKCVGVLLGLSICGLAFFQWLQEDST